MNLELIGVIFLTAFTPLSSAPRTVTLEKVCLEHVEYNQDSTQVTARATDGTLYVHNARTGQLVGTGYVGGAQATPARVPTAFSADKTLVVTGDRDLVVRVRHVATGEILAEYEGHLDVINDVAISPDGLQIASVGDDGMGLFWPMP